MKRRLLRPKLLRPSNVVIGAAVFTLFVEKATAQVQPNLPAAVLRAGVAEKGKTDPVTNFAQWANVETANGIHAQMRAGSDVVIRSELFTSIATVSLIIAIIMMMFRIIQWAIKCSEARVVVPVDPVQILTPLFLSLLLVNPVGQGFAMQTVVVGTGDLLNSFQSYILTNGNKATLAGGSAVRQANAKAQIERSIFLAQVTCSATLDQVERQTCYDDAFNSVSKTLDSFRSAQWAYDLANYASDALLKNGKFANQSTNAGTAVGGVIGSAVKRTTDTVVNATSGIISPIVYTYLLLISSAFGILVGILQMLISLFFPLSIALSFAPIFEGSWIKWFTGMFQIWLSGLFLRMLVTILAIVTIAGSSVSGGLYVISVVLVSAVCGIMATVAVISTITGIAGNVTTNVANMR